MSPVTIVWPCPLSVDAYAELGKDVEVPRPDCPRCVTEMVFWSGYLRPVRVLGRCVEIFVRRARCTGCSLTHALLPAFALAKRLDVVEAIGSAIEAVVDKVSGVRPVAERLVVPHTTVRQWLRRFGSRGRELAVSLAALSVELGSEALVPLGDDRTDALSGLRAAYEQAASLPGWAEIGRWRFCSSVSGGNLLATNTISPYLLVGKRRFMPPVPLPGRREDRSGGS